jgi:predicted protein tyrosine phosphatase
MTRRIYVCSLEQMPQLAEEHDISHIVSVLSREQIVDRPEHIAAEDHLRLSFNDVSEAIAGFELAKDNDISRLIDFAQEWHKTGTSDLLVHCWLGVSRAPASCYIMACALMPEVDEMELAQNLRNASAICTPNSYLVQLADQALSRQGRMIKAIETIGRGDDYQEGSFALEVI